MGGDGGESSSGEQYDSQELFPFGRPTGNLSALGGSDDDIPEEDLRDPRAGDDLFASGMEEDDLPPALSELDLADNGFGAYGSLDGISATFNQPPPVISDLVDEQMARELDEMPASSSLPY